MRKKILQIYLILLLAGIFGFFIFLGSYALLDVDETRYVHMAEQMFKTKDFMTLYLNGDYFFEKPPMFFWLECSSFKIFGSINEFTARLPIVLLSFLPVSLLFDLCRRVKNIKFAFICTLTLLTSFEYVILSKIAILDSVFTSFLTASCLCYLYTFYVKNKNKKYFWYLTYIFSALAVLTKGLPGIAIPVLLIGITSFIFKTQKESIKYSSLGIILFLLITLPWHIIMLKMYNSYFFEEYIYKHHILRFLGSPVIDRTKPWYFYLETLLWGFFPHIFVFISYLADKIRKTKANPLPQLFAFKFLGYNIITALIILVFFSISKGKLATYILPLYPFLSVVTGFIWLEYINKDNIFIKYALLSFNIFIAAATVAACFAKLVLPSDIYCSFKPVQITFILLCMPFAVYNIFLIYKNYRLKLFISLCFFTSLFIGILTPVIYNFNYSFGQNDLMLYAKSAKDENKTISTYLTGKKYSLLFYSGLSYIDYKLEKDNKWFIKELNKKNNILIVRNKDLKNLPSNIKIAEKGRKYSVIEK